MLDGRSPNATRLQLNSSDNNNYKRPKTDRGELQSEESKVQVSQIYDKNDHFYQARNASDCESCEISIEND